MTLPPDFSVASVALHKLGEFKGRELKFEMNDRQLSAAVNMGLGASLLMIQPAKPETLSGTPAWRHVLPAEFKLEQPRCSIAVSAVSDPEKAAAKIRFKFDNRASNNALAGSIVCAGKQQAFSVPANGAFECDIEPQLVTVKNSALVAYHVVIDRTLVARGDAMILFKK
jgi:hypothetical protein